MNCFEWKNHSSDYMDGTLLDHPKRAADEHLSQCPRCQIRREHFQKIISSIQQTPRRALPISIRKNPLKELQRPFFLLTLFRKKTVFKTIPWPLRYTLEGLGLAIFILCVVVFTPKIQLLYEKAMERRMDPYLIEAATDEDWVHDEAGLLPLDRGKPRETQDENHPDDFSSESGENEDSALSHSKNSLAFSSSSPSEIWRFNIKTDSPREIRLKIIQVFKDLKISTQTQNTAQGVEAPGGIQFDLLIPTEALPSLKQILQQISLSQKEGAYAEGIFSWFKNKSKRALEPGKTRVVIWLSQM